ncbi:MAG: tetratricopeptide repeat protein [Myxococcota bacterium]
MSSRFTPTSLFWLVSLVALTTLTGCPDKQKMATDHLRGEGYLELEVTAKDGSTNAFKVVAKKDGKPCKGEIAVMSMPGSSSATYNTDVICKAPKAPEQEKVDPLDKDRAACKAGDMKVCVTTGQALIQGPVGSRDPKEAGAHFTTACDGGELSGCVELGTLHVTGLGVDKSEEKASALFTKACDAGDMLGCARQGKLHYINREGKSAMAMTKKACDGGAIEGCLYLGKLYQEGIGTKQKFEEARKYFQAACDGEEMVACSNLGVMVMRGEGGSKNISRAKELLQLACEGKVQPACYHLKKL